MKLVVVDVGVGLAIVDIAVGRGMRRRIPLPVVVVSMKDWVLGERVDGDYVLLVSCNEETLLKEHAIWRAHLGTREHPTVGCILLLGDDCPDGETCVWFAPVPTDPWERMSIGNAQDRAAEALHASLTHWLATGSIVEECENVERRPEESGIDLC